MQSPIQRFGACACTVLAWCSASVAAVPTELGLQTRGACPSAEAIERQLKPLLPLTLVRLDAEPSSTAAEIWDTGDGFAIRVGGAERAIAEPARDCMERARISAVFIALALDPPLPSTDASDATKRAAPVPSTTPMPAAERSPWELSVSVSAGLSTSLALGRPGSRRWGVGPSLGVALGSDAWEIALSGAVLTPFELEFAAQESVRLLRAPFELSYRWLIPSDTVVPYLGFGVEMDLLHMSGVGFEEPEGSFRVGVGGRLGVGVRAPVSAAVTGFVELAGSYFPRPYSLEVSPNRVLGETPTTWLALTLGAIL